jgi:hypothetical protein
MKQRSTWVWWQAPARVQASFLCAASNLALMLLMRAVFILAGNTSAVHQLEGAVACVGCRRQLSWQAAIVAAVVAVVQVRFEMCPLLRVPGCCSVHVMATQSS